MGKQLEDFRMGDRYTLGFKKIKAHDRIIWSIDISHDNKYVCTASRDKSVKVWKLRLNKER